METLSEPLLLISPRLEPVSGTRSAKLLRLLSSAEKKRFGSIRSPLRRRQFLTGRSLLRQALVLLTGSPQGYAFPAQGPPQPRSSHGWHFSVSHSKQRAACLLSRHNQSAVDIEWHHRRKPSAELIRQCLPRTEQAQAIKSTRSFLRSWTLREAAWKANRRGINLSRIKKLRIQPAKPKSRLPWGMSFSNGEYQFAAVFKKKPAKVTVLNTSYGKKTLEIRAVLSTWSIQHLDDF